MWNRNGGCRPTQNSNFCPCGCCSKNTQNRPTGFPNSLYVLTTPWNGSASHAQAACGPVGHDIQNGYNSHGGGGCVIPEFGDEERDIGNLTDSVPSNAQAAKCIEKLQHLVLVKVQDPATSIKCLQDLFMLKKVLVDDCRKKKRKDSRAAEGEASVNGAQVSDGERRGSQDSQASNASGGSYGPDEETEDDRGPASKSVRQAEKPQIDTPAKPDVRAQAGAGASSDNKDVPPAALTNPIVARAEIPDLYLNDENLTRKFGNYAIAYEGGRNQPSDENIDDKSGMNKVYNGAWNGSLVSEVDGGLSDWLNKINQNPEGDNGRRKLKASVKMENEVKITIKPSSNHSK